MDAQRTARAVQVVGEADAAEDRGFAVGGLLVPLIALCLDQFGWRNTAFASGLISIAVGLPLTSMVIFGGVSINPQIKSLKGRIDVLVATPGRLLDLIDQRHIDLSQVEFFVLDEVDRMLDMGFLRDVKRIVSLLPAKRQSLFFSATLAPNIVNLAQTILSEPAHVSIAPETTTAEKIDQQVCFLTRESKRPLLEQLLRGQAAATQQKLTIVFSRTKHGANKLAQSLCASGIPADAIHGNKWLKEYPQGMQAHTGKRVTGQTVPEVRLNAIAFKTPKAGKARVTT